MSLNKNGHNNHEVSGTQPQRNAHQRKPTASQPNAIINNEVDTLGCMAKLSRQHSTDDFINQLFNGISFYQNLEDYTTPFSPNLYCSL